MGARGAGVALAVLLLASGMSDGEEPMVIDFRQGAEGWPSINDVVMGGRSWSRMEVADGVARFTGEVSLENNGGFASVRSRPGEYDLGGCEGLRLRLRGDGKRYKVRLRTSDAFDGVSYQAVISPPAGEWVEEEVPFDAFEPVYRGRRVTDHPPLEPARIRTFGLLISDRQEGPFALELEWIAGAGCAS